MKRFTQLTTAGTLATALLLTACASERDQQMQALKSDPVMAATWDEFNLISSEETNSDSYKSSGPTITLCYKTNTTPEEAIKIVMATAAEHGWSKDSERPRLNSASATKVIKYGFLNSARFKLIARAGKDACREDMGGNLQVYAARS